MNNFKCKSCGATIIPEEGKSTCICDYCGSVQTVPNIVDNERLVAMHNRANQSRLKQEFDDAMIAYENIISENEKDAEAHWGIVLCRYGIEYVLDPKTKTRIPTSHRIQTHSIFDDIDYKASIENADVIAKKVYQTEAEKINQIQKASLAISQKEEPYDIFICYKEKDENNKRTRDSLIAQQIYENLTSKGYRVFYARITLESKVGVEYEPYIFAALNSSKIMLVIGTKPEYFTSVWVKNEWSRFLFLMKQNVGTKYIFPCYRDMDPYDLPEELRMLQAQDLNNIGFVEDLTRGIEKLIKPKTSLEKEIKSSHQYDGLLKRAYILIKDSEFTKADDLLEQVLNQNPEDGEAYLYKLLISEKLTNLEDLAALTYSIENKPYAKKVLEYGTNEQKELINQSIKNVENNLSEKKYLGAKAYLDLDEFDQALNVLETIKGYKDVNNLIEEIKTLKFNQILEEAKEHASKKNYADAILLLNSIEKTDKTKNMLSKLIDEYNEKLKASNYDLAMQLYTSGSYEEAIKKFESLGNYLDVSQKIDECKKAICELIYQKALTAMKKNEEEAKKLFESILGYKDSVSLHEKLCQEVHKTNNLTCVFIIGIQIVLNFLLLFLPEMGSFKTLTEWKLNNIVLIQYSVVLALLVIDAVLIVLFVKKENFGKHLGVIIAILVFIVCLTAIPLRCNMLFDPTYGNEVLKQFGYFICLIINFFAIIIYSSIGEK